MHSLVVVLPMSAWSLRTTLQIAIVSSIVSEWRPSGCSGYVLSTGDLASTFPQARPVGSHRCRAAKSDAAKCTEPHVRRLQWGAAGSQQHSFAILRCVGSTKAVGAAG